MLMSEALSAVHDGLVQRRGDAFRRLASSQVDAARARVRSGETPAVGEAAPTFRLPSTAGTPFDLARRLDGGGVVIAFIRGHWCPFCVAALSVWRSAAHDIDAAGITFVVISPEDQEVCLAFKEEATLPFDILSDADLAVAKAYGLDYDIPQPARHTLTDWGLDIGAAAGTGSWRIPATATFAVAPSGVVRFADSGADYGRRAEPAEVLAALAGV